MTERRNNRNRTIRFNDRNWSHQQAQALLRALGASDEVKVQCLWGHWYATVHYRGFDCFDAVGHGKTMWLALADALDGAPPAKNKTQKEVQP